MLNRPHTLAVHTKNVTSPRRASSYIIYKGGVPSEKHATYSYIFYEKISTYLTPLPYQWFGLPQCPCRREQAALRLLKQWRPRCIPRRSVEELRRDCRRIAHHALHRLRRVIPLVGDRFAWQQAQPSAGVHLFQVQQ